MRNFTLALAIAIALLPVGVEAKQKTHESRFVAPTAFTWAPTQRTQHAAELAFWQSFDDPVLSGLVERALTANTDLRVALAHYDSANALLRASRFDQFPTVTAQAAAGHNRLSADEAPGVARADRDDRSYAVGAHLSWELDLFGRVRNSVSAQRADTAASAADLQALQVLIVADVSRSYFQLRGLQERLRVAKENVDSQTETLRLVQAGFDAGRGTEFDTSRARAQLATTRSRVPSLEAELATTWHRLAVLTGQAPESAQGELATAKALAALPPPIDPGTPGELLARRPDVAAAQARLAAATARVGAARAGHRLVLPRLRARACAPRGGACRRRWRGRALRAGAAARAAGDRGRAGAPGPCTAGGRGTGRRGHR